MSYRRNCRTTQRGWSHRRRRPRPTFPRKMFGWTQAALRFRARMESRIRRIIQMKQQGNRGPVRRRSMADYMGGGR